MTVASDAVAGRASVIGQSLAADRYRRRQGIQGIAVGRPRRRIARRVDRANAEASSRTAEGDSARAPGVICTVGDCIHPGGAVSRDLYLFASTQRAGVGAT